MGRRRRAGVAAKRVLQQSDPVCRICHQPLGKHRWGDDACPNMKWKVGNGQDQWSESTFTEITHLLEAAWA